MGVPELPDRGSLPLARDPLVAARGLRRGRLREGPCRKVAEQWAVCAPLLDRLADVTVIRVAFPSFADGRGFTIARQLRRAGFAGRLRATGHVIADQYAMARRAGFDEVEIGDDLAARQPEAQWLARADWRAHDYQSRLGRRRDAVTA